MAQETVAVLGLGAVGVITALLLQRSGATVIATDPSDERRDLAVSLGIPAVDPDELSARLSSQGVPLLLELSGPTALAGALDLLSHEGTALVGSWYGRQPVELPLGGAFHRRRLTIRSSQVSTIPAALAGRWDVARRRRVAVALLGELPLATLATTEFAFGRRRRPTRRWTAANRVSSTSRCAINSAVYETGTALQVEAFHVMPGMPPPEGERHSHDYRLDVVVRRDDLDERGMVVDLDLLDGRCGTPPRGSTARMETVVPAEAVTVEVFARWVHDQLAAALGRLPGASLAVRVWESPVAFGGYTSDL